MAKTPNEQVLFQGAVYDRKLIDSFKFPIGCTFHYNNASYNSEVFFSNGSPVHLPLGRIVG